MNSQLKYESTTWQLGKQLMLPWLMWGAGALFYFYEFLVQVSPNAMSSELMRDFSLHSDKLGVLVGVFFWAYAFMQIPAGVLLDKLGPHRLLAAASAMLAIGCVMFSYADKFTLAILARFAIGIGSAFAVIGCMKLAANWFPPQRFALMIGLTVTIGMSGAIIGEAPLRQFIELYDWRLVIFSLSILGALLFMIFFFLVRDHPKDYGIEATFKQYHGQKETFESVLKGLKEVLVSPQMWIVAIYGCLMFAPTLTFCGLWGGQFIELKCHVNAKDATAIVSSVFFGWVIGSPLCGLISDMLGKRIPTMMFGSFGALLCFSFVLFVPDLTPFTATVLLFFFGLFSSGFLTSFSIVRESAPPHCAASALGFMNMMNMLGIALMQPMVGIILKWLWQGQMDADGTPIYTLEEYQISLVCLPIILLIAGLLTPLIKETFCHPQSLKRS